MFCIEPFGQIAHCDLVRCQEHLEREGTEFVSSTSAYVR